MDWVVHLPCHFGDLISKMESAEKSRVLMAYESLVLTCPRDSIYKSFGFLKRMILKIISSSKDEEKPSDIAGDLEGVSWKLINERLSTSDDLTTSRGDQKKIAGDILDILKVCKTKYFEVDFFMDILHFTL